MNYSLPGSSIHEILQVRILEWVANSFSRGPSRPRDQTRVSHIVSRCFTLWATREAQSDVNTCAMARTSVTRPLISNPNICPILLSSKKRPPPAVLCLLSYNFDSMSPRVELPRNIILNSTALHFQHFISQTLYRKNIWLIQFGSGDHPWSNQPWLVSFTYGYGYWGLLLQQHIRMKVTSKQRK